MPRWDAAPSTSFATAYFGDEEHTLVIGGIRFYFGQDRNKSLIRRHREDDPAPYTPIFPRIVTINPITSKPSACPAMGMYATASYPNCTCPGGFPPYIFGNQGQNGTCDLV